ncbi:hypothetical protein DID88_003806 [Monilinia fructigena]|uniref:Uncharacterized protein n=1 Tax=Monilinia fructigena TaxID=38457 RepID=A0A395ISY6_9HELO|nr:hypothetical protein DID88_003806 [Monilinia fructigena]
MAPVEIDNDPSVIPTVKLGGHIVLASSLTALTARTLYRSYLALPPSSATRHRLVTAVWFGVNGARLSYSVWAAERGVELPDSFFGDKGAPRLVPLPENVDVLTDTRRAFDSVHKLWFEKIVPQRASNWLPNPGFYIALLLSGYGALFLTPFAANTSSFGTLALLSVSLPLAPLLLPYIIPEHWGTTYDHPHEAHPSYTKIFRVISIITSILHIRTTGLALLYNTPENHYYRHSLLRPLEKVHRSNKNRAFTAIERVLGAVGDHPAVGAVGYDVILSGLSLGTWAAVRGLDGVKVKEELESVTQPTDTSPPLRRRRRPRKPTKSQQDATYDPKVSINGTTPERDQDEDEDWEVAALTWGVVSAAGLGVGSASVYGAEITAR